MKAGKVKCVILRNLFCSKFEDMIKDAFYPTFENFVQTCQCNIIIHYILDERKIFFLNINFLISRTYDICASR